MNSAAPETTSTPIELPDRSDFSERLFQILPRADFDLSPVLNRSTNQLYLIQQSGQEYLLKVYGNRERFGDPQKRLSKEVFCLQSIRAENMAPELIGYDRSAGFMVMHFVRGRRVGDEISPDNYAQIARATGHWLARFHGQFERRECGLSAWDYFLTRYRDRLRPEVFGSSCQRRLEAEPLPYAVFAKNDAHKQNFLIASEAPVNNHNCGYHIYGIDYEFARYTPPQFELAELARSLSRKRIAPLKPLVDCILEGYSSEQGTLPVAASWTEVIETLVHANIAYLTEKKHE